MESSAPKREPGTHQALSNCWLGNEEADIIRELRQGPQDRYRASEEREARSVERSRGLTVGGPPRGTGSQEMEVRWEVWMRGGMGQGWI